jgi:hypothetical protein
VRTILTLEGIRLAVMVRGFTTAIPTSPLLEVFQHDLCQLYYHADLFWVTESVGEAYILSLLDVFSRDRSRAPQPIVEVEL